MNMLKFALTVILSITLSGCLSTNAIYDLGFENGRSVGYDEGFTQGVDTVENRKYATHEFAEKYQQFDFNSIKFFYLSSCQRELVSRAVSGNSKAVLGLSLQSLDRNSCVVFFEKPASGHDEHMTTLGHEVAHCLYGTFHGGGEEILNNHSQLTDSIFSAFINCNDVSDSEKERLMDGWKIL
jgi:hypothetical protein